jgi:hypothetical protein
MTHLITTLREYLFGSRTTAEVDPVYKFFIKTSSAERKKVYNRALKKAQAEQEKISREANQISRSYTKA